MNRKIVGVLFASLLAAPVATGVSNAAVPTTTDVPVNSVYYNYIEKLSGMGYITSMPTGAKPYSRAQMAKWVQEAEAEAVNRPMPAYLADQLQALETYLASELSAAQTGTYTRPIQVTQATASYNYLGGTSQQENGYGGRYIAAKWQPFGAQRQGYLLGTKSSFDMSATVEGNLTDHIAVSLTPRFDYTKEDNGKATLAEGYAKLGLGAMSVTAGKEAMTWGQGASGNLLLGDSMRSLTSLRLETAEPIKVGGFFRFLGEVTPHVFYTQLEGNREAVARAAGATDVDHAGLLGMRVDITPTNYFTLGISRISMLGGDSNGLSSASWKKWVTGTNAYTDDKWDDIAGFDARLRLPGVQLYGELYGEDQANYMPSQVGYRAGVYIPNLADNGAWDLTVETAKTGRNWYYHGRYRNGWTYHGQIMGDQMGPEARVFFAKVNHYWTGERSMGLFVKRTTRNSALAVVPTDLEVGITGQYKVNANTYLNGEIGVSHGTNQLGTDDTTNSKFVNVAMTKLF